jgi:hypothetical protein
MNARQLPMAETRLLATPQANKVEYFSRQSSFSGIVRGRLRWQAIAAIKQS